MTNRCHQQQLIPAPNEITREKSYKHINDSNNRRQSTTAARSGILRNKSGQVGRGLNYERRGTKLTD